MATLSIQLLGDDTLVVLLVVIAAILRTPNGIDQFGLQTMLYHPAQADRAGSLAGFQNLRHLGAIYATSLLRALLASDLSRRGKHHVGFVMASVAALLLVATIGAML